MLIKGAPGHQQPWCWLGCDWCPRSSPVSKLVSLLEVSSPNNVYQLISRTTDCRLYSNISQILLQYKVWGYYYKFDTVKSLAVYYWYVKMPWNACVCGAWIRIYYILCSKTHSIFGGLFWTPIGSRRAARGAPICETRLSYHAWWIRAINLLWSIHHMASDISISTGPANGLA